MKISIRLDGASRRIGAAALARLKARIAEHVRQRAALRQDDRTLQQTSDRREP